jgi:Stress responsive A/B Barrel Domain
MNEILIQDRIRVAAADLPRLRALVAERYLPAATERGLTLVGEHVSPPLSLADQPGTLWLRWTLPHVGAFWTARAQSYTPEVIAFWAEVDSFIADRERLYLAPADTALPGPEAIGPHYVRPTAWRETAQLHVHPDTSDEERDHLMTVLDDAAAALPGLVTASLTPNLVADYGAGHFTWDLVYADEAAAAVARKSEPWRDQVLPALDRHCRWRSALGLETAGAGARDQGLRNGIKRTALFRLLPGIPDDTRERFERDTLEMPAHIPAIVNWRLSRAVPLDWDATDGAPWTHVWEQEYAALEGLTVDYMVHPHHWAHVDRWFDVESGTQVVDAALCHAFAPLPESLIVG